MIRSKLAFACLIGAGGMSGCANLDLAEFQPDMEPVRQQAVEARLDTCAPAQEVLSQQSFTLTPLQATPAPLADEEAIEIVSRIYDVLKDRRSLLAVRERVEEIPAELSGKDMHGFARSFSRTMLNPSLYTAPEMFYAQDTLTIMDEGTITVGNVFREYYEAYINGEFIDRFGTKLSKPEVKDGVTNDTIKGAVSVFIEAFSDFYLRTPLIVKGEGDKKQYLLSEGKEPTVAKLKALVPEVQALAPDQSEACGITELEVKAIRYLANLAGDKSELLFGLILELFGDIEVASIVGGNISIGDNDTLAKVTKTFFEGVSRRGTEKIAYEAFWQLGYPEPVADVGDQAPRALGRQNTLERFVQSFASGEAGS